jgi:sugar phosphate isomerase/epimerase
MSGHRKVRVAVAALATGALLGMAPGAQAQRPASLGEGAPVGQSGIQLYNFSSYLSNGAGEIICPASPAPATPYCVPPLPPSTTMGRMERLFAFLQSRGVKNVELYGYPGNPFPSGTVPLGNPQGALELRALGDKYGIRFPARHGSLNEARWDAEINISRILGQDHVGESGPGGAGGVGSYQQTLRTAEQLNKLGKRSVEAGLGPAYFHNHAAEFGATSRFMDNGVLKSGWEIVMERTDPRWVVAQIDIGWAVCGGSGHVTPSEPGVGVAYVQRMIDKFGARVISFHVKDMAADGIRPNCGNNEQRTLGQGAINFAPMLASAKNETKYYFAERDPVAIGGPTNFNPFNNTADSAVAMKGDPAPTLKASPLLLDSVPAGTAAAANQKPIVVTNDGDAPLTIGTAANVIAIQADANDGGNTTAGDFAIVSEDCRGKTLAPGATCTINVGFKPTRTNYASVARVVINANGDDAMERILIAGTSTENATSTPGGTVPTVLSLSLPAQNSTFGTFQPGVGRNYETAISGSVISTAGGALLSVSDPSTTAPGHLTNGAFALPQPLNVRAINSANPGNAFVPLAEASSTQTSLLSYTGPVTGDLVTIGFRQAIGAGDVLRAGTYNKTLTFSLSATTP